jgi:hypothetical protein
VSFVTKKRNMYNGLIFFLAIMFCLSTLIVSWKYCRLLAGKDTRIAAKDWIENNIERDRSIMVEGAYTFNISMGGPPLKEDIVTLNRELDEIKRIGGSGFFWKNKIRYVDIYKGPAYNIYKFPVIVAEAVEGHRPDYVVLSNYYRPWVLSDVKDIRDYLDGRYVCIKKIMPDVYINFFPSFEALYYDAFARIDKLDMASLGKNINYGPVIEIYEHTTVK